MTFSFGVFTFVNVWWVMLFITLPFGVRKDEVQGIGYVAAPKAHKWKKLVVVNSLISLVVTVVIAVMIHYGVVPLKGMG